MPVQTRVLTAGTGITVAEADPLVTVETKDSEIDHGSLDGLSDDDHSQYVLLAGRAPKQVIEGAVSFGDGVTDYAHFDGTGHLTFEGSARPWNDVRVEPEAKTVGPNTPAFEKWIDDAGGTSIGVYLFSFTDVGAAQEKELFFTLQMPHDWDGGTIHLHVHWIGNVSDVVAAPRWGLEYTWANVGAVFGDTTIIYTDGNNYDGSGSPDPNVTAFKQYVSEFSALVPTVNQNEISSMLICRVFRNSGSGSDTYNAGGNKCGMLYVDAHYQIARVGSNEEFEA